MATSLEREFDPEGQKKWQCGTPYQYPIPGDGDHWQKLLEPKLEEDRIQCESWKEEVQNLLIFAGLFSAVVSAFVVVSYPSLQPDQNEIIINLLANITAKLNNPPISSSSSIADPINTASLASPATRSAIRINIFWFTSLVLSLTTALIGIVSLQWLREHQQYPSSLSSRQKFALFGMRAEGLVAWYVPQIFSSLPLFLQSALVLFFAGLIDFLLAASSSVAIPVVMFTGIPLAFLILTTTIPALQMFVFCLPLAGSVRKVPPQAPYKSTQSRLFQQLLTTSKTVFAFLAHSNYAVFYWLPSRLYSFKRGRREGIPDSRFSADPLQDIVYEVFGISKCSRSWLSLDESWLALRDAYAKSIFNKSLWMSGYNIYRQSSSWAPIYDLANTMISTIQCYYSGLSNPPNPTTFSLSYLCLQEMSSCVNGDATDLDSKSPLINNLYLQVLLHRYDRDLTNPFPTFSSLLLDAPTKFMDDENRFIFLSQFYGEVPSFILRHSDELYIRITNYLYPGKACRVLKDPLTEFPTYRRIDYIVRSSENSAISEQFSSFARTYLEVIANPSIDYDTLLRSLYSGKLYAVFQDVVETQCEEDASSALNFVSKRIKDSTEGILNERSDFLFYVSSFYVRTLLEWGCWNHLRHKDYDKHPVVGPFLSVLHQYLDAREIPDVDLCKRLGIFSRPTERGKWGWWYFLEYPRDQSSEPEESEIFETSSQGPDANKIQDLDSIPSTSIPEVPPGISEHR